ncbi:scaffolding protein [Mycobacterium phage Ollie]|uniref:Scaffolding protein n=1 Tax=Mycobacterium phage Ollie TaxID=2250331 RepID=A0A345L533_9CAUD|nr:scaffolding protein [Mycobacterium phage Ollie]
MSDTPTTTDTPAATDQGQEPKVETFSREYVEGLRSEAARYRNEKKDAVEEAKTATRAEVVKEYEPQIAEKDSRISELEIDLSARALELLKIKAVLNAEIPSEDVLDVVTLIQGTDDDTVSESVKRVKALLGKAPAKSPAFDPTQGSGSHLPLNGNPLLDALKRAVGA